MVVKNILKLQILAGRKKLTIKGLEGVKIVLMSIQDNIIKKIKIYIKKEVKNILKGIKNMVGN